MLKVIAELQIEEDDQALHQLRVVDQMGGPQQLLPQLTQFQPADTPERLEAFIARLHAYPAFMAANAAAPARRPRLRSDRAAHRRRADDRPDRADARGPDRVGHRAVDGQGRLARRTASASATSSATSSIPADLAFLDTLRGDYLAATREDPGLWSAPERRAAVPDRDPQLDDARPRSRGGPPDRPRRARVDRGRAPGHRPRRRLRRRHRGLSGVARRRPGQHAGDEGRARRPGDRGHRAGDGDRAALLRRPAAGAAATSARSRSTRRRTRRSPTTTRRRPTARGRASTTPTATTCPAASTPSSPRRPTTRPLPATTSRSRSRWRTRTSTRSVVSARGWSVARTSRAGASTASAWPTRWASSATRRSASGCSTRRPGGPPGWSSTPGLHALRWPRQRSIDFLKMAGLSDTDAEIETDRYICWPGQALTYKIGQREIERLRAELSARDGSAFDLRAFHDAVLGPRIAAAGDAQPRAAELAGRPGLTPRIPARDRQGPASAGPSSARSFHASASGTCA